MLCNVVHPRAMSKSLWWGAGRRSLPENTLYGGCRPAMRPLHARSNHALRLGCWQRGDIERPRVPCCVLHSQALGEHTGLPQHQYRWRVAMARIREAQGDLDGALGLLDEAERVYVPD